MGFPTAKKINKVFIKFEIVNDQKIKHISLKIIDILFHFRCILVLNVVFVTVGSIYTYFSTRKINLNKPSSDLHTKNGNHIKCANINAILNVDNATIFSQQTSKAKIASSFIERFFSCFCIVKNSEIITTDSLGTDSIEVIHGMR